MLRQHHKPHQQDISNNHTGIYTLDGKRVEQQQKGVNIIKTAEGVVKKIVK